MSWKDDLLIDCSLGKLSKYYSARRSFLPRPNLLGAFLERPDPITDASNKLKTIASMISTRKQELARYMCLSKHVGVGKHVSKPNESANSYQGCLAKQLKIESQTGRD